MIFMAVFSSPVKKAANANFFTPTAFHPPPI